MRRRRAAWLAAIAVTTGLVVVVGIAALDRYMQTGLRERAIVVLEDRLESEVRLADLQVSLGTHISVKGKGLVVRHHRRTDVPPLVSLDSFEAIVPWSGYFETPPRLSVVSIHGLQLTMPPSDGAPGRDKEGGGCQQRGAAIPEAAAPGKAAPFIIDRLTSRDATLALIPSTPHKRPRVFAIAHLC